MSVEEDEEEEDDEEEHETYKTKKAPLREGPNFNRLNANEYHHLNDPELFVIKSMSELRFKGLMNKSLEL